jgi:hypothetical protein
MAKRYGRNQKRAARARIAELEAMLMEAYAQTRRQAARAQVAERQAADAEGCAFERFAKASGMLGHFAEEIARAMGRHLAGELEPIARDILNAQREAPRLGLRYEPHQGVRVMRGHLPPLQYNVAITHLDMRAVLGAQPA